MDRLQQYRTPDSRHYGAASEGGAETWATLASLINSAKLHDIDPAAYIAETLEAIIDGHPHSRIEELMPWRFRKASSLRP
jgi:hypothetical protein